MSIGTLRSLEMSARGGGPGRVGRREKQGENHGGGVGGDVVGGRDAELDEGEEQTKRGGDDYGGGGDGGGQANRWDRHRGCSAGEPITMQARLGVLGSLLHSMEI